VVEGVTAPIHKLFMLFTETHCVALGAVSWLCLLLLRADSVDCQKAAAQVTYIYIYRSIDGQVDRREHAMYRSVCINI